MYLFCWFWHFYDHFVLNWDILSWRRGASRDGYNYTRENSPGLQTVLCGTQRKCHCQFLSQNSSHFHTYLVSEWNVLVLHLCTHGFVCLLLYTQGHRTFLCSTTAKYKFVHMQKTIEKYCINYLINECIIMLFRCQWVYLGWGVKVELDTP